jgi:hypothetical protein
MKKAILLSCTFLCFTIYSFAQRYNEQPGFIVTTAGDTVAGFVKDQQDIQQFAVLTIAADGVLSHTFPKVKAFCWSRGVSWACLGRRFPRTQYMEIHWQSRVWLESKYGPFFFYI